MATPDIEIAKQLAEIIFNEVDAEFGVEEGRTLETVGKSLHQWQGLLNKHGFDLVGVDVFLPTQLADKQRAVLKSEFEKLGFKYETIGVQFSREYEQTLDFNLKSNDPNATPQGGSGYTQHPELDVRGMPLQRFYISEEDLRDIADTKNNNTDNKNDYKLSLKFSPSKEGPRLQERAVYKDRPELKPSGPTPRLDLTIRPF